MTSRIYGKQREGQHRFKPMDLREGKFVTNLIFATLVGSNDAQRIVESLNADNPTMTFEARDVDCVGAVILSPGDDNV